MQQPKMVLGLIGPIGSGKDFVADHLVKNHGFKMIGMGDVIREEVERQGKEKTILVGY